MHCEIYLCLLGCDDGRGHGKPIKEAGFFDQFWKGNTTQSIVDELGGHKIPGESFSRYGKPYLAKIRYEEARLKLDFEIDLSHLKQSKWVPK